MRLKLKNVQATARLTLIRDHPAGELADAQCRSVDL